MAEPAGLLQHDPVEAAAALLRAAEDADAEAWIDQFAGALERQRGREDLERILDVWGLSQADAGRLFGVSRQAVGKWLSAGIPEDRLLAVADLAGATDLLVRYLRRERIPAVVRRPAAALDGRSLMDLLAAGRTRELLEACRSMFAFTDAHG